MNTLFTEQLQKHKITITALLSLLLFLKFPPVIRMLDYTAAPLDAGIVSAILLVIPSVLTFILMSHLLIEKCWPVLHDFANDYLERCFKQLCPWQKVSVYLVFHLGLLYAFVLLTMAVL